MGEFVNVNATYFTPSLRTILPTIEILIDQQNLLKYSVLYICTSYTECEVNSDNIFATFQSVYGKIETLFGGNGLLTIKIRQKIYKIEKH